MEYTILNTDKYYIRWIQNLFVSGKTRMSGIKISVSLCSRWYILKHFWREKFKGGTPLKFFVRKVARGNAVQMVSNFPAKSLSI